MREAKLFEVRAKSVVVQPGQDMYRCVRADFQPMPVLSMDMSPIDEYVINEELQFPVIKICKVKDKDCAPGEPRDIDVKLVVLSDETREVMEVVRMEEEGKHLGLISQLNWELKSINQRLEDYKDTISLLRSRITGFNNCGYFRRIWQCIKNAKMHDD